MQIYLSTLRWLRQLSQRSDSLFHIWEGFMALKIPFFMIRTNPSSTLFLLHYLNSLERWKYFTPNFRLLGNIIATNAWRNDKSWSCLTLFSSFMSFIYFVNCCLPTATVLQECQFISQQERKRSKHFCARSLFTQIFYFCQNEEKLTQFAISFPLR